MRLLSLALRGLWWRRATSAALLAVAAFTTTAAAAGPIYAAAASDAVLQQALRIAPVDADGTGVEVIADQIGRPSAEPLGEAVSSAFRGRIGAAYPTRVRQLSAVQHLVVADGGTPVALEVVDRQGVCGHVRIVEGACLDESDRTGFVVDAATARSHRLRVGQRIAVADPRGAPRPLLLHLLGVVAARSPADPFWFGGARDGSRGFLIRVPTSFFTALRAEAGDGVLAAVDLPLAPHAVHLGDLPAFQAALDTAATRVKTVGPGRPTVSTGVDAVVARGTAGAARLGLPIVVVVIELLALGWYVLHVLVSGAAEARGAEVALGKLRGLTARTTLVFTLLEPVLLLVVAVPVGVLAALIAVGGLGPAVLGPDARIGIGVLPWAAAGAAAAGGIVAAATASIAVLRRPVLEQWRRTVRRPAPRAAALEAAIVVLAVAGIVQLRLSGTLGGERSSGIALVAPALLTVAGAIVASRLIAPLARLAFRATRGAGAVAAFVGVRQLARRPAGRRTFGVLAVAVSMAVFGVSSAAVLAQNRHDRALVDVGASTVLHVVRDPRTVARVRAVDDGAGRITAVAQAVTDVSSTTGVFGGGGRASAPPTVLVVDPDAFASVASWRADFGSAPLARLLRPLRSPAPVVPRFSGTTLTLDVDAQQAPASLSLAADLVDPRGAQVTADLGALRAGARTYSAAVAACAGGCDLRRIYVTRPADRVEALVASFTVRRIRAAGRAASPLRPAADAVDWSPLNPAPGLQAEPAETVRAAADGLHVLIAVSGSPGDDVPGFGAGAGTVRRQPALVATGLTGGARATGVDVQAPDGGRFGLVPSGRVDVVPRAGDGGVVLARDWAVAASPDGSAALIPDQVWVAANAPADTVERLRRAGVAVTGVERADDRAAELARQGPSFATALTVTGGGVAVLLAAATAVLALALLARRRVFELSAMRTLGIGVPSLIGSVVLEQAALIVAATTTGTLLGAGSAALALPALPAYVDDPAYPAFVVHQPLGAILLVAAAVVVLLLAAVTATAVVLARAAAPSRLREAEG